MRKRQNRLDSLLQLCKPELIDDKGQQDRYRKHKNHSAEIDGQRSYDGFGKRRITEHLYIIFKSDPGAP